MVKPGDSKVLPVMSEMMTNEDGVKKQDCEQNAIKRWIVNYGQEYQRLKPTILGDDLFSNYPACKAIVDAGMSFILTCKPDSHPWLTETVKNSIPEEPTKREWNGRNHLVYRYKWVNGVAIRDRKETVLVNYISLENENGEQGKITYTNSWVTDKTITANQVRQLVTCGRARWKRENEHNNVLKNRGYNLKHNVGHGEQ
jgi:hypothetical protein